MRTRELSSSRFAGLALLCATVFSTTGCPECRYYNDCPSGQACSTDRVCVDIDTDPGSDTPPPPPPNDGGTIDGVDAMLATEFPVQWLTKDPRDASRGLYAVYEANGGNTSVDALRAFDLTTGARRTSNDLDFIAVGELDTGPGTPCRVDNFYQEDDIPSAHDLPESWLMCRQGPGVRIYYDNNFAQPGLGQEGVSVDGFVMVPIVSAGTNANDFQRRLTFERGGSTLNIYQVNPQQDGIQSPRTEDTVLASFEEITQVWQIPSLTGTGDVIVVFDAGASPKALIPLVRQFGTLEWQVATPITTLAPLVVPRETHAAFLIGTIDPGGQSDPAVPNVMTIESSTGFVRFYTMNNVVLTEPAVSQFFTQFEPNASFTGATPESKTRLLLEPAPGGGALFYMHPLVGRVWRIPFTPNAENDVRAYTIGGGGLTATGLVPTDAYTTWLSIPSTVQLIQVTVTVGG